MVDVVHNAILMRQVPTVVLIFHIDTVDKWALVSRETRPNTMTLLMDFSVDGDS